MTSSPHLPESHLTRRTFVGAVATAGAAVATGAVTAGTAAAAPPVRVDRAVGVARIGGTVHTLGQSSGGWFLLGANGSAVATTGLDGADLFDLTGFGDGAIAVGAVLDGDRSMPAVFESADGLAWRAVSTLTGLDGHLTAVAAHGSGALAVGALLTLERAPRQRIALRRETSWSVVPLDGLGHTDEWAATSLGAGAEGFALSTVDASGSMITVSPDGLDWTAGGQLVDAAVRSLAFTGAGVRWVGNAIGGSGGLAGVVGGDRRRVPVPPDAEALGVVGDQSYWLAGGRLVSAKI